MNFVTWLRRCTGRALRSFSTLYSIIPPKAITVVRTLSFRGLENNAYYAFLNRTNRVTRITAAPGIL